MTQKSSDQSGSDHSGSSKEDQQAFREGLRQLDRGEFLTREEVRSRIRNRYGL